MDSVCGFRLWIPSVDSVCPLHHVAMRSFRELIGNSTSLTLFTSSHVCNHGPWPSIILRHFPVRPSWRVMFASSVCTRYLPTREAPLHFSTRTLCPGGITVMQHRKQTFPSFGSEKSVGHHLKYGHASQPSDEVARLGRVWPALQGSPERVLPTHPTGRYTIPMEVFRWLAEEQFAKSSCHGDLQELQVPSRAFSNALAMSGGRGADWQRTLPLNPTAHRATSMVVVWVRKASVLLLACKTPSPCNQ